MTQAQRDNFAKNLRKLLRRHELRQEDLAKAIGVARNTIGSWIARRVIPTESNLEALAEFFDCSTESLLRPMELGFVKPRPGIVQGVAAPRIDAGPADLTARQRAILLLVESVEALGVETSAQLLAAVARTRPAAPPPDEMA